MDKIRGLTVRDAIGHAYASYNAAKPFLQAGPDRLVRHPEWTRRLLNQFGSPDKKSYNVAVTGSKGKGSHAILLAAILEKCGLRTGLFTGPHLVDFMERFRIDGEAIDDDLFVSYMERVYQASLTLPIPRNQYVGPVGLLAVVASLWFQAEATDVNIFELGRGALHDDVNQLAHQGAVVTPVFLEHALQLGPTLGDVAMEKSAVVDGTTWVTSTTLDPQVRHSFVEGCRTTGATLRELNKDFHYHQLQESKEDNAHVKLSYTEGDYLLKLPSGGLSAPINPMLAMNAAVAFDAARQVMLAVKPGQRMPSLIDISQLQLPGRLQVLREQPFMVLDGTIHAQSARYIGEFTRNLKETGRLRQVGLVAAMPADKDGVGVFAELEDVVDWVILTRAHNPHLYFDRHTVQLAHRFFPKVAEVDYVEDALTLSDQQLSVCDGLLLLGTQSFVGDTLRAMGFPTRSMWNTLSWEGSRT